MFELKQYIYLPFCLNYLDLISKCVTLNRCCKLTALLLQ